MDENDEGSRFCEEDIDQILQRRATTITIESEGKGSTFSKASFVASENRTDIALDDPEFWQKWAKKADIDVDSMNRKVCEILNLTCAHPLIARVRCWFASPNRTPSLLTLPESASKLASTPVYGVKVGSCLIWTVMMSIRLPIPDSPAPPDVPTATAAEVMDALTASGLRNTCSSMGE